MAKNRIESATELAVAERMHPLLGPPHTHTGPVWECSRCGEYSGTFCWSCIAIHNTAMHTKRCDRCGGELGADMYCRSESHPDDFS